MSNGSGNHEPAKKKNTIEFPASVVIISYSINIGDYKQQTA
jgi:hypothetical protein